jgi:hypothetical protein
MDALCRRQSESLVGHGAPNSIKTSSRSMPLCFDVEIEHLARGDFRSLPQVLVQAHCHVGCRCFGSGPSDVHSLVQNELDFPLRVSTANGNQSPIDRILSSTVSPGSAPLTAIGPSSV